MKIACAPTIGGSLHAGDATRFRLFGLAHNPGIGTVGNGIVQALARQGMAPVQRAWDLLSIALSIVAADESSRRDQSADGWTRQIELEVAVAEPDFWNTQTDVLDSTLSFLTGDIWHVRLTGGGLEAPMPVKRKTQPHDAVCLLSGGMDSLIGALDLATEGRKLMLVSQVSKGDKDTQLAFATRIPGAPGHLQLNHNVQLPPQLAQLHERSQRARSIIFLAYGVLAASALDRYRAGTAVDLFVPENGFISLNIPLTPIRIGSLSTRTTHPAYMAAMQRLLDAAGLHVPLANPYQFKTKGEMLVECREQTILKANAFAATSCGRYARNGYMHCGRCVPCLVRRAAIRRWGLEDQTRYRYGRLAINDSDHRNHDDVRAAAIALEQISLLGFDRWAGTALNSAQLGDTAPYRAVVQRGLEELRSFLAAEGVL